MIIFPFETKDQEGLPDYWGIETSIISLASVDVKTNQEGLPDYWGIETRKYRYGEYPSDNQEGLPDYWGIETDRLWCYSPTYVDWIRKDYPTTGVLKLVSFGVKGFHIHKHQEGLPDYWGIETIRSAKHTDEVTYQEGLPDYWGIETYCPDQQHLHEQPSGRITRLLGY